nr:hypothetical protein [Tanacetum cinerariifolium]
METPSLVSKYLNGLEDYLYDEDSLEARKLTDAKLDIEDSFNYITEERFDMLGFVRLDYGNYGRKIVKKVRVENHGFTFWVKFVVIGHANKGEPSMIFGRDFLVTSKSRVDFGIGEMCIDLTMLQEMKDIDVMFDCLFKSMEEVGSSNGELVKMGEARRNKIIMLTNSLLHHNSKLKKSLQFPPFHHHHPFTAHSPKNKKKWLKKLWIVSTRSW